MTITDIESLTYEQAKEIAIEMIMIKDHDCFFVDLGGDFGYSVLVFKNGRHIYFANDYELHHGYMVKTEGKESLKEWYIETLNRKLFTDKELLEPVLSYGDYKRKDYFLRNYWIMRYEYVSIFVIGKEDQMKIEEEKKTHPFFNPICFCYVENENIVNEAKKYNLHLQNSFKKLKENNEAFRKMVRYELDNHEACVSYDYEAALDSLGLRFEELPKDKQKIVKEELNKQIKSKIGW